MNENREVNRLSVAHIPGDGIGPEVTEVTMPILTKAADADGCTITWQDYDWGGGCYARTGMVMPTDALEQIRRHDAALFGAMGGAYAPDSVSAWGLRLALCQGLDQYVCLRPAFSTPGVDGPLGARPFDLAVVRENTEGEYSGAGGRVHQGLPEELAVETAVFTRRGIERATRYACELATTRRGRLTIVTKANVQRHVMGLWDEVTREVSEQWPELDVEWRYVDAVAAELLLSPERFDVVIGSNAHGDILTDLTGAMMGSLGMAGSANLDPSGQAPGIFEPAHGSAPDLVGARTANPVATIRSGAMLLEHCGLQTAAGRVNEAINQVLKSGLLPHDLGGSASTNEVAQAVLSLV